MPVAKEGLSTVCYLQYLYVIGGRIRNRAFSQTCERYAWAEDRWEAITPLSKACAFSACVVLESCLYTLGGRLDTAPSDFIQKLYLQRLTWEVLTLRLPSPLQALISVFKLKPTDSHAYFVMGNRLYRFLPQDVQITLLKHIKGTQMRSGSSYFNRGMLYGSDDLHGTGRLRIGEII
jgi:hypothetical protein